MVPEIESLAAQDSFTSLRRGFLEFAVLSVLSTGSLYAAEVLTRLDGSQFATREGTLYPLFGKMRRDGLLKYEWHESESGPPRKYYHLTESGGERLKQLRESWQELSDTLARLGVAP